MNMKVMTLLTSLTIIPLLSSSAVASRKYEKPKNKGFYATLEIAKTNQLNSERKKRLANSLSSARRKADIMKLEATQAANFIFDLAKVRAEGMNRREVIQLKSNQETPPNNLPQNGGRISLKRSDSHLSLSLNREKTSSHENCERHNSNTSSLNRILSLFFRS